MLVTRLQKEASDRQRNLEKRRLWKERDAIKQAKADANRLHNKPHDPETFDRLTRVAMPKNGPVEIVEDITSNSRKLSKREAHASGDRLMRARSLRPKQITHDKVETPKLTSDRL